jgi:hypothetical protein
MHHLMIMARFNKVSLLAVFIFFSFVGLFALQEGQSKAEVSAEMGQPNGKRSLSDGEIWVYSGDITLEFRGDQLVRAKGAYMQSAPEAPALPEAASESPVPANEESAVPGEDVDNLPVPGVDAAAADNLDEEIRLFSEGMPELPEELDGLGGPGTAEESHSPLFTILWWVIPVFLGFIFLLIAFKLVGAEADKSMLLLIAMADQLVTHGVQWFFLDLLGFPSALHADSLASFVVMLVLVTKLTHAKQLPTAIKVVIISKVAGLVAGYFLFLFLLHNL